MEIWADTHALARVVLFCVVCLSLHILNTIVYGQRVINHDYPRLAAFYMGGGGQADWLKRFDLIITLPEDSALARQVHALNPDAYVLCTRDWNQGAIFWRYGGDTSSIPNVWKVRDKNGYFLHVNGPYHVVDITGYCGRYSGILNGFAVGTAAGLPQGETYSEALARVETQKWNRQVWDGYSSDGTGRRPCGSDIPVDLDRDGISDWSEHGARWIDSVWQAGLNRTYRDIRTRWGSNGGLLVYHSIADTVGKAWANGCGWEDIQTHGPYTSGAWKNYIYQWQSTTNFLPRINWAEASCLYDSGHAPARKHDYFRFLRWALGWTLMTDAYFNMGDVSPSQLSQSANTHQWATYYDEFDVRLGFPTTSAQQIGSTGVYVRFFDNGCVIVNESNSTRTVTDADLRTLTGYNGDYYRFKGNQDPTWNNGSKFASVTLITTAPSWTGGTQFVGDGVLLVKVPTTIVSDIIVDNAYGSTTPGSAPATIGGRFTNDESLAYPNKAWSMGPMWWDTAIPEWWWQMYAPAAGTGTSSTATFSPAINVTGQYRVYEWHGTHSGLATKVPCKIYHAGSADSMIINQSINNGQWNLLGSYAFSAGGDNRVVITNNANGNVIADAFKFVYADSSTTPPPDPPSPINPKDGTINQPINLSFQWTKSAGAQRYRLELSFDSVFSPSSVVLDTTVTDTLMFTNRLLRSTTYFERLIAQNAGGSSGWSRTIDFTTVPPGSFVLGTVCYDKNNNRLKEADDPGMSGWTIRLLGPVTGSVITDANGEYHFSGLSPGTYSVSEDPRYAWTQTFPYPTSTYSFSVTSDTNYLRCNFGNYASNPISFDVDKGWNLISLPMKVADRRKAIVYPVGSRAFGYNGSYSAAESLEYGRGYWISFEETQKMWIAGSSLSPDTVICNKGWNLIGSINTTLSTSQLKVIPSGIISSSIWAFSKKYVPADSIRSGQGYWVQFSSAGKLILSNSPGGLARAPDESSWLDQLNSLTVTSASGEYQRLFFSSKPSDKNLIQMHSVPPLPPEGVMDVRYLSDEIGSVGSVVAIIGESPDEQTEVRIRIQSLDYPLKISWDVRDAAPAFQLRISERETHSLAGQGQIVLGFDPTAVEGTVRIIRLGIDRPICSEIPTSFGLEQNYPNPFNGSTRFRFSLPEDSHVHLSLYNVLGERIAEIIDKPMSAGVYSVPFNDPALTTGIYFYRLDAVSSMNGLYTNTRKMILLK